MAEGHAIGGIGSEPMVPSDPAYSNFQREQVSLPNIPMACPDQTLDSIAALTGLLNGLSPGRETIKSVFGSPNIKTDRAFHAGLRRAYGVLGGLGYSTYEEFSEGSGFLPFFRPFVSATTYEQATRKLESNIVTGLSHLLSTDSVTVQRDAYRYCVECAAESIKMRGYAFARRTDQFLGVDYCTEHGKPLCTLAPGVPPVGPLTHGLIIPSANNDWRKLLKPIEPLSSAPAWCALGVWVKAVLSGVVPKTSVELRTALLQRRILEISRAQGDPSSPGGRCERHLIRTYGADTLKKIGLSVLDGVTRHWPAFLVLGTAYTDHPLANLLTMSALFDSPPKFAELVGSAQKTFGTEVNTEPIPPPRQRSATLDLPIIRAFYRGLSIVEIARLRGLDHGTVESVLKLHPSLQQRRKRYLERHRRTRMRQAIEAFVRSQPDMKRKAVEKENRSVFTWLMRHDRAWLDHKIPTSRPARPQKCAHEDLRLVDARIQRRLVQYATQHFSNHGLEQVTKDFLIQCLKPYERKKLAAKQLPKSARRINSLVESREAHLGRVERHLISLMASGKVHQARLRGIAAISTCGHQPDYVARISRVIPPNHLHADDLQTIV